MNYRSVFRSGTPPMSRHPASTARLMRHFSTLAGPLRPLPKSGVYRVGFRHIASGDQLPYRIWTYVVAYGTLLLVLGFGLMLFRTDHWVVVQNPTAGWGSWLMLGSLALLQLFLIVGTYSATRSTVSAKDPVPVRPPGGLRVAFCTTRAPGEPASMVETTLKAMKRAQYKRGQVDVWLLDETNEPELAALCKRLGVRYFSRQGVERWNTVKAPSKWLERLGAPLWSTVSSHAAMRKTGRSDPYFAGKSKHGNFNAWLDYLPGQGISYDILTGVDTDQVPEPNYLQRLLGYFRDPDVAFVVGPQVYGNFAPGPRGLVARWAESQASFFQSTIQRAGNASASPMFVGTNYAVRFTALAQIGGFQPCITEDMATGLAIHAQRNPATGERWKSVYTPDVLAIGEGPEFWAPYFTQQWRWAAGAFDTWRRMVWRLFFRLSPKAMLHYFLILTYYPIAALTFLLGIISSLTYLLTGATAILAPWSQFVSLYLMMLVMQLSLYFWNRRYNVSPHEAAGSYGIPGMALSTLVAPIYLSALVGTILGKKNHFVVTTKGGSDNPDRMRTFKVHLQWALLLVAGVGYGVWQDHDHPALLAWVGLQLVTCLVPCLLGLSTLSPNTWRRQLRRWQRATVIGESRNA